MSRNHEEMLQKEASFHDTIAGRMKIDDDLAQKFLAFDSPAPYLGNLSRLKQTLLQSLGDVRSKRVLVYGCGNDSAAVWFSKSGADVDAIDISLKSVENQNLIAEKLGLNINTIVMDAHSLDLPSDTYDVVYGNAILHHLELEKAVPEIVRVLKPGGKAVFRDVLEGNIFLRAFRMATPQWRTTDEHPLKRSDFDLFSEKFARCQTSQYILTGLPYFFLVKIVNNVILKKLGVKLRIRQYNIIYEGFDRLDKLLFRFIPILKRQAWICLIVMESR